MFFNRKKQTDSDQTTVLTETLRSLEDLIAETSERAPTDTRKEAAAAESRKAGEEDHSNREAGRDCAEQAEMTAADQIAGVAVENDLPVLTDVVYMPIPRVAASESTPVARVPSTETAREAIVTELVSAVGDHLDPNGQPPDAGLTRDLRDAVSASLEDWSLRTQDILRKHFTPPNEKK